MGYILINYCKWRGGQTAAREPHPTRRRILTVFYITKRLLVKRPDIRSETLLY